MPLLKLINLWNLATALLKKEWAEIDRVQGDKVSGPVYYEEARDLYPNFNEIKRDAAGSEYTKVIAIALYTPPRLMH